MELTKLIKKIRKTMNLTQVELAYRLGVTQPIISEWENGNKGLSVPAAKKLITFCRENISLKLSLEDLI